VKAMIKAFKKATHFMEHNVIAYSRMGFLSVTKSFPSSPLLPLLCEYACVHIHTHMHMCICR